MTKVLLLPLVPKGSSMDPPPPEKTIFPPEFCYEICTLYVRDIKNHTILQKKKKMLYRFKMGAKKPIFISRHFDFGHILKNHFPKGIFQWNLAQRRRIWIDLHYWNKIFKKIIPFQNGCQNNFLILRNNANLC